MSKLVQVRHLGQGLQIRERAAYSSKSVTFIQTLKTAYQWYYLVHLNGNKDAQVRLDGIEGKGLIWNSKPKDPRGGHRKCPRRGTEDVRGAEEAQPQPVTQGSHRFRTTRPPTKGGRVLRSRLLFLSFRTGLERREFFTLIGQAVQRFGKS